VYGRGHNEELVGRALADRRDRAIVATKFAMAMGEGPYSAGGSRRYVMRAVEASLRRLGTDYIDLYQMHVPDPTTPIEETLEALTDLVHQGKVRYLGSSNLRGWELADRGWEVGQIPPCAGPDLEHPPVRGLELPPAHGRAVLPLEACRHAVVAGSPEPIAGSSTSV